MLFRRLALAGAFGVLAAAVAAQDLRPPRELPPPGFRGQQYTDSSGCVFLRAGLSGRTNWVPRIGPNRRQLCGYPPTFTPETDVAAARPAAGTTAAPAPAAAPAPVAAPRPAPEVTATRTTRAPAPSTPAVQAPARETVQATRGCPDRAPYGQRARRADGTTALYCAATPAALAAAIDALATQAAPRRTAAAAPPPAPPPAATRAAVAPATAPVAAPAPAASSDMRIVCPAGAPNPYRVRLGDGSSAILCAAADGEVQTAAAGLRRNGLTFAPIMPPGYKFAWEDDRLNPRRGQGTVAGQVAQDRVWTRDVPARLVTATPAQQTTVAASNAPGTRVTVSSANDDRTAPARAGRLMVQVGSYGVPANADAARGRLSALGLPVAGSRATIKGKPVQVVYAGPFATQAEAQQAVSAVRRAGFPDAFIR